MRSPSLIEPLEVLAGGAVGASVAQRTLADGASPALCEVVGQARAELSAQSASLAVLRGEVAQEAMCVRGALVEAGRPGCSM